MTYEEIQKLDGTQPYCFETDREEQWYKCGLVEGADVAYAQAQKDLLECGAEHFVKPAERSDEVDFDAEYAKFHLDSGDSDDRYTFPIDLADYKDFARHFYNLGINARQKEKEGVLEEQGEKRASNFYDLGLNARKEE